MKDLRLGLVGTGFIAPFHYQGFAATKGAKITGLCTHSNQEKARRLAAEWGIRAYVSFDDMADDPNIDALVIGSMNTEHFAQVLGALDRGKPVLVEKPVVTDLQQVEQLKARSATTGVPIMPAHNFVYRRSVREARRLLDAGRLGTVTYGSFLSTHTISPEHAAGWRSRLGLGSGGALMDSGHHQVYQSLYLLGVPERLQAFSSNLVLTSMEGEDIAQVSLRYPGGALGSLLQSWTSNHGEGLSGIRILGTEGQLVIGDALTLNGTRLTEPEDYAQTFQRQAEAFVQVVRREAEPLSTLDDVAQTLRIIAGAYDSCATNRVVGL